MQQVAKTEEEKIEEENEITIVYAYRGYVMICI